MCKNQRFVLLSLMLIIVTSLVVTGCQALQSPSKPKLRILSSSENKALIPLINKFTDTQGFDVEFVFKGSVDSMSELSSHYSEYDAVWLANSQWISMGDTNKRVKDQKSVMTSPVVWGIRKSVAEKLGFVGRNVTVQQLAEAVQQKKLQFAMTSASQSNSGASAYIGFLYAMLDNPSTLTIQDLQKPELAVKMKSLLSGVNRSSGSSEWLKDLFLKADFDAMVNYEAVLIDTNKSLIAANKEPLYLIYPTNGLTVADYSLGYINNGKSEAEERFKSLQGYLLSAGTQKEILSLGRRTGFGGVVAGIDKAVFNPDWGIDMSKTLSPIAFPEPEVIREALNRYQTLFKKPSYTVFCIDYSGSMSTNGGERGVKEAMGLLLNQEKSKQVLLQSSAEDTIVVMPFNSDIIDKWSAVGPGQFPALLDKIQKLGASGGTNIYDPSIAALNLLSRVDTDKYVVSVVLMTDGMSSGRINDFQQAYTTLGKDIPVFSITFGDADEKQLRAISNLTHADVFPSGGDLTGAFKKVRGYN